MSDAQWRVLGLLVVAYLINATVSPKGRKLWQDIAAANFQDVTSDLTTQAYALGAYGIGILLLVLLAQAAPSVATWVAFIILLDVTLVNAADILGALDKVVKQQGMPASGTASVTGGGHGPEMLSLILPGGTIN